MNSYCRTEHGGVVFEVVLLVVVVVVVVMWDGWMIDQSIE